MWLLFAKDPKTKAKNLDLGDYPVLATLSSENLPQIMSSIRKFLVD